LYYIAYDSFAKSMQNKISVLLTLFVLRMSWLPIRDSILTESVSQLARLYHFVQI